jgi:hypothetical protein
LRLRGLKVLALARDEPSTLNGQLVETIGALQKPALKIFVEVGED